MAQWLTYLISSDRYDFPLLRAELSAAGIDRIHLEPGSKDEEDLTFCADSLVALRSVYSEEKKEVSLMPLPRPGTCVFDEDSMECPSSSNTTPTKGGGGASDFNGVGNYPIPVTPPPSGVKNGSALPGSVEDVAPETTPDKSLQATPPFAGGPPPVPRKKPKSQQHPLRKSSNPSSLVSSESAGELKAKKRLDFNVPVSFSLPKLHEHMFGSRPRVSHGAEADCMALLRVCALKYPQVSAWFNTNARQFAKVKPLW